MDTWVCDPFSVAKPGLIFLLAGAGEQFWVSFIAYFSTAK